MVNSDNYKIIDLLINIMKFLKVIVNGNNHKFCWAIGGAISSARGIIVRYIFPAGLSSNLIE